MDSNDDLGDLPTEDTQRQVNECLINVNTNKPSYANVTASTNIDNTRNENEVDGPPLVQASKKERTFTFFNLTSQDDMTTPVADALAAFFKKSADMVIEKLQTISGADTT